MPKYKKIRIGDKVVKAIAIRLLRHNFILLWGSRGYVMCGYLNLKTAEKFKDVAVKITGVSTIEEALQARVYACTTPAKKAGIFKGQSIKDVLRIIA
ncbi:MAG: DUF1805 domain-containing protein [Candidatus Omnitrophica bacterium]|nr:DUF1805 domain-containing protein [Candidatus Omnitrophota bacterium]